MVAAERAETHGNLLARSAAVAAFDRTLAEAVFVLLQVILHSVHDALQSLAMCPALCMTGQEPMWQSKSAAAPAPAAHISTLE